MGFSCEGATGVGAAGVVACALRSCGYANVFDRVPSGRACAEPIVVRPGGWEREARFPDGVERGREKVRVHVCMDSEIDAVNTAAGLSRDLPRVDWLGASVGCGALRAASGVRVLEADCGAVEELGRDSSGRWVVSIEVSCVVVLMGVDSVDL